MRIICVNSVKIIHRLGELETCKFLFWTKKIENHSSTRKYFKTRNYVYLWKKSEISLWYSIIKIIQIFEIIF